MKQEIFRKEDYDHEIDRVGGGGLVSESSGPGPVRTSIKK
jgi:hypothetical protein